MTIIVEDWTPPQTHGLQGEPWIQGPALIDRGGHGMH